MKAESKTVGHLQSEVYNNLRYGQFNVLRLIKAADSSQSSCLNWQAIELLRTLLVDELEKKTNQKLRSFLVSRSTIQKAQYALEAASDVLVPVEVKKGEVKLVFFSHLVFTIRLFFFFYTHTTAHIDGAVFVDVRKALERLLCSNPLYEERGLSEEDYRCAEKRNNAVATVIGIVANFT